MYVSVRCLSLCRGSVGGGLRGLAVEVHIRYRLAVRIGRMVRRLPVEPRGGCSVEDVPILAPCAPLRGKWRGALVFVQCTACGPSEQSVLPGVGAIRSRQIPIPWDKDIVIAREGGEKARDINGEKASDVFRLFKKRAQEPGLAKAGLKTSLELRTTDPIHAESGDSQIILWGLVSGPARISRPGPALGTIGTAVGAKHLIMVVYRQAIDVVRRFVGRSSITGVAAIVSLMPVEFLTDEQAEPYGRFAEEPTRPELERFFFLDDEDRNLISKRRGDHNRLGFALQMCTVRYTGLFLEEPLTVPWPVVEHLAEQLEIEDVSCVKEYVERLKTAYEHAWEIRDAYGYHQYEDPAHGRKFRAFLHGRAWTHAEGPVALFNHAVGWLRRHRVLLSGVNVLARQVSEVRTIAERRLHATVAKAALRADPALPGDLVATLKTLEGTRHAARGTRNWSGCVGRQHGPPAPR